VILREDVLLAFWGWCLRYDCVSDRLDMGGITAGRYEICEFAVVLSFLFSFHISFHICYALLYRRVRIRCLVPRHIGFLGFLAGIFLSR